MQEINYEVKSKGEVLGTVVAPKFESIAEAIDHFTSDTVDGESAVLTLVNRQNKANVINAERIKLTRGVNPMTALKTRIEKDPAAKQKLEALLVDLGLV